MACTYALLVGIDAYFPPVRPLSGCVADALAMQTFLQARAANNSNELNLVTLTNEQATRQAIIDQFRQHLGQAGPGDTALFYFCGHGSQAPTAREFLPLEPDGLDETLVCHDSRQGNVHDLADKELSALIAGLAHQDAHVVILLDACHSGTATRDIMVRPVRRTETDTRQRSLSDYIVTVDEVQSMGVSRSPAWANLPAGRHIVLSACQADELAMEQSFNGQTRGVFSWHLVEALQASNEQWTYRDLFNRVNSRVRASVEGQSPRIEANNDADLNQTLLGGAIQSAQWLLDEEAASAATNGDTVQSALQQRQRIRLSGDEAALKPVRAHLSGNGPIENRWSLLQEVTQGETLILQTVDNGYQLSRTSDSRPLAVTIEGHGDDSAAQALDALEHVARWLRMLHLDNPTSQLPANAIALEFHSIEAGLDERQIDPAAQSSDLRLHYREHDGQWRQPAFRLKLENRSGQSLHAVLLDLTDRFRISSQGLFPNGRITLEPGESVWANQGDPIPVSLPEAWWNEGLSEYRDVLKVIASTEPVDSSRFDQGDLSVNLMQERPTGTRGSSSGAANATDRMISRGLGQSGSRDFGVTDNAETTLPDWTCSELTITTVRPLLAQSLVKPGSPPLPLSETVRIQSHPKLRARARLSTPPEATRDMIRARPLPAWLRDDPSRIHPLPLSRHRGVDSALSVLELDAIEQHAAVTPEAPLTLEIDASLDKGEHVLAIVFDEENQLYLPCGIGRNKDGKLQVDIDYLPEPAISSRSLFGSVKIFFSKVVSKVMGTEFEYPILASVNSQQQRNSDTDDLSQAVKHARRIVLYIHGIIGDTDSMAASAFKKAPGQTARPIGQHYDLVLAFDYENLNTEIEENARLLKQRLAAIGLEAGHGKELHIVAHSMGGLVSRWFIEQEGGKDVVSQLIMLGTPNLGSPWSSVENWLAGAIGIGLNRLSVIAWPAKVLTSLLAAFERSAGKSLEQMGIGSEFLEKLENSEDPGVPYTIIAGNTSLIERALETTEEKPRSLFRRLLSRLNLKRIMHSGASLAFSGDVNDVAVSTEAILGVPQFAKSPVSTVVACDHMSYFMIDESLLALDKAVAQESSITEPGGRSVLPS